MSQQYSEVILMESTPVECFLTPVIEDSESTNFMRVAKNGSQILGVIISLMVEKCTYHALSLICQDSNWRKIAFAMGLVFHTNEHIPVRVQIAKGHDSLRGLVITCVTNLRRENAGILPLVQNYDKMVDKLFTSHGYRM